MNRKRYKLRTSLKPKPISSPPDGPRDTSLTFSTLTLWPHSSSSPSLSLSFGDQKLRRAHRFVFLGRSSVPRRRRHRRCMLLSDPCFSLSRPCCNLSLLRFPVTKTRSRLHRRSSSPALAVTASAIDVSARALMNLL
ncbi:uncharacterized protein LOC103848400 [Brassica rapa]|uniref:uncharacterized protein LOC103848400 n=1 Tax=Brassica campestris TaxID=3711 RepID=UPI00142D55B7|nr:uncharacterized protein LOC103848400 [Brassica rapa]